MTACFEVFLIGFCFRSDGLNGQAQEVMTVLLTLNLGWFMLLIAAVSPHRQSLLDWARYRREGVSSGKSFWNRSVTQDLVWGEKSPSLVAIALNLAIMVAIMTPWILTQIKFIEQFSAVAVVLSMAMFLLICSAIAQMMLLIKSPKRAIWATAVVSVLVLAPPFMLSLLSIYPRETPVLWLFTAFGVAAATVISPITVLFTLLGQLAVLSALVNRMTRQLQKAGESQSKAILASAKS
jgi:NAD/NADP transhydrogenase alpha subunit